MASTSRSKLDDDEALEPPTASASASSTASPSPSPPRRPPIATRIHSPSPSPPLDDAAAAAAAAAAANGSHSILDDDAAMSHHPATIPRKPMHRSISVPLSHRMGDLRHPRPLKSTASFNGVTNGDEAGQQLQQQVGQEASTSSLAALLRHRPHRSSTMPARLASSDNMSPAALAHLVLDTLQLPIAHLLHVIPPHLLDASHETLSATSLAMPVTTVEALLEAFRSINWVCDAFADTATASNSPHSNGAVADQETITASQLPPSESQASSTSSHSATTSGETTTAATTEITTPSSEAAAAATQPTFDLFELAQRAADVVSGQASDKSLELVLSCSSSKASADLQAMAQGDAGPVRCVLIHALSRYLEFVPASSSVELDVLLDEDQDRIAFGLEARTHTSAVAPRLEQFQPDASVLQLAGAEWIASDEATLKGKLVFPHSIAVAKPLLGEEDGHHAEKQQRAERQRFLPRLTLAEEPTASQLVNFGAFELSGKRAALHASDDSAFARNLTALLKRYGCEVTRIAADGGEAKAAARTAVALSDGRPAFVRYESELARAMPDPRSRDGEDTTTQAVLDPVTGVPVMLSDGANTKPEDSGQAPSSVPMQRGGSDSAHSNTSTIRASSNGGGEMEAFSFLMVDDDIDVLQQELLRMRSALPILRTAMGEHAEHNGHGDSSSRAHARTHAIIFFTSLSNFRSVKDVVQPIMEGAVQALGGGLGAGEGANALLPEIVVIPKPAGARRVLTALHTAVHKPLVDPFFAPIATSPMSPHLWEARMNWSSSASGSGRASRDKTPSQQRSPTAQRSPQNASTPPQRTPPQAAQQQRTPPSASSTPSRASGAVTPSSPPRKTAPPSPQRSPNRRGPGMRIPNFPRTDPASVMSSAPPLPTPLRRQLTNSSEGDGEGDETVSSLPQQPGMNATPTSQPRSPLAALRNSRASPAASGSASPSPSGPSNIGGPASSSGSAGLLVTPALSSSHSHRSSTGSSSPMPVEALEYFSETAARLGGSGASGMMIQSTDGRPAGIFFQPKRSNSNYSSLSHGSGGGGRRSGATSRGGSTGAATPVGNEEQAPPAPSSASSGASAASSSGAASGNGSHRRSRKSGGEAGAPPEGLTSPRARPITEILDEAGTAGEMPVETPKRRTSASSRGAQAETPSPVGSGMTPLTSSNLEQVAGAHPPAQKPETGEAAAGAAGPAVSSSTSTMRNAGRPADETQSSAPTDGTTNTATTTTDWQTAPPGTLFAPQVDIEQVLAARTPPLATPISQATAAMGQAPSLPPPPASLQARVEERRDSVKREEGIEMSRGPSPATTPPPLAPRDDGGDGGAEAAQPARKNSTAAPSGEPASGSSTTDAPASRAQPSAAHATSTSRPSAQPQSGLLIGAGFAPTARRGAPSRRAAVREKVLPPIKVLIVEDNPINQRILKQFMNRKRIQSEVAVNGREAVDKWATGGFHLILMDIQLPVMDGIEATKEIRRREMSEGVVPPTSPLGGPAGGGVGRIGETPTPSSSSALTPSSAGATVTATSTTPSGATTPFRASVIIVALTASSLNSDKVAALSSGCNDFLQKPVSLVWLEKKIIEWGSMQYIVGYLGDEKRLLAGGGAAGGKKAISTGGTAGASLDVRRAFGRAPDVKARQLASKLHLPTKGSK